MMLTCVKLAMYNLHSIMQAHAHTLTHQRCPSKELGVQPKASRPWLSHCCSHCQCYQAHIACLLYCLAVHLLLGYTQRCTAMRGCSRDQTKARGTLCVVQLLVASMQATSCIAAWRLRWHSVADTALVQGCCQSLNKGRPARHPHWFKDGNLSIHLFVG